MKHLCWNCNLDRNWDRPASHSACATRYLSDAEFYPWRRPDGRRYA